MLVLVQAERVVIILGWLGSLNDEFDGLAEFYRERYPGCKVLHRLSRKRSRP